MRFFALRAASLSLLVATFAAAGCEPEDRVTIPPTTAPEPATSGPVPADINPGFFHRHAYAEPCVTDGDCASNVCSEARCTVLCDEAVANSCRDVDAFCVPDLEHGPLCAGNVETGDDIEDDRDIALDSPARGVLQTVGDADMFELRLVAGRYRVTALPSIGDVRVEVYDQLTKSDASIDNAGFGEKEEGTFVAPLTGSYYIVVRDAGGKPTSYAVGISRVEE